MKIVWHCVSRNPFRSCDRMAEWLKIDDDGVFAKNALPDWCPAQVIDR